jgi:hypothetical protein
MRFLTCRLDHTKTKSGSKDSSLPCTGRHMWIWHDMHSAIVWLQEDSLRDPLSPYRPAVECCTCWETLSALTAGSDIWLHDGNPRRWETVRYRRACGWQLS